MCNIFDLANKKILVTGASSGIGKAISIRCADLNGNMIVTGRDEERLTSTYQALACNGHLMYRCDLSNEKGLMDFCSWLPELDGVVMCAAGFRVNPAKFNKREYVNEMFNTNTFANFDLIRYLLKQNKIKKRGSVIFISSVASNRPYKGNSLYSATKGALNSYAKVLSIELAHLRIRVNCVHPGIVKTEAISVNGTFTDEELQKENDRIPMGFGTPEDIANGCAFLLSDASSWITGTDLVIDGGQSLV